jgi:hypothetical protein
LHTLTAISWETWQQLWVFLLHCARASARTLRCAVGAALAPHPPFNRWIALQHPCHAIRVPCRPPGRASDAPARRHLAVARQRRCCIDPRPWLPPVPPATAPTMATATCSSRGTTLPYWATRSSRTAPARASRRRRRWGWAWRPGPAPPSLRGSLPAGCLNLTSPQQHHMRSALLWPCASPRHLASWRRPTLTLLPCRPAVAAGLQMPDPERDRSAILLGSFTLPVKVCVAARAPSLNCLGLADPAFLLPTHHTKHTVCGRQVHKGHQGAPGTNRRPLPRRCDTLLPQQVSAVFVVASELRLDSCSAS